MGDLQIENITNLDYLVQMMQMAYKTEQFERVIHIADHLYSNAQETYKQVQFLKAKNKKKRLSINRPLVYYFGISHLLKGLALQKLERYYESLECIDKYQELGWFIGLDEYITFLLDHPEEIIPECITILEAAIAHGWQIDEYLDRILPYNESFAMLEEAENVSLFVHYMYCLALYKLPLNKSDVIDALIRGIAVSCKIDLEAGFRKSCALFETLRESATENQVNQFKNILKGAISNEKNYAYISCHV
ncbi:hypothetical protein [Paenibacillus amylolyticus]|uniref:hypothetical protein n=1 Tax=Paenibacillus amylolyticus TaxID=1451 RepID=UPI003241C7C0